MSTIKTIRASICNIDYKLLAYKTFGSFVGLIIGLTLLTACLAFVLLISGIVLWHRFRSVGLLRLLYRTSNQGS